MRVAYPELNLGLLWESDLSAHRKAIGETVLSAQGEMALEEFLRQVQDRGYAALVCTCCI